jgi:ribosomal protein L32
MTIGPKKKISQSKKRSRHGTRQRLTLKKLQNRVVIVKNKDGDYSLAHHVSPTTGKYKGKQVINIKQKGSDSTVVDA